MQAAARRWAPSLTRQLLRMTWSVTILANRLSIRDYLSNNNVQLGATYPVGQKCNALFDEGEAAGARYINASTDEIGLYSPPCFALDKPHADI